MYQLDKPDNLVEMVEESIAKFGEREWLGTKNKENVYEWVSYKQVGERIDNLRGGLAHLGVDKNETVAVIANNSVDWVVACYAAYGRCARYVPMYKAELVKVWEYITKDSNTKVLFVADRDIYEKVKNWPNEIEDLKHVVLMEGEGPGTMAELEEIGKKNPVKSVQPNPDDIAGLIYTSGTTGEPKGVLLSHGNITSNVHGVLNIFDVLNETDRSLSFLPWAHSYGQTVELHSIMRFGGSSGFAESPQTIVDDLLLVKPTLLIAVPRIFNRVYDGLMARMNEDGGIAKLLFDMGVKNGKKKRELAKKGKSSFFTNFKFNLADKIVFSKIREKFGNRLLYAISSSAALSSHIAEFFFDVGIPVYEAWGMTEVSPAGAVNSPAAYKVSSGGKALDKVRLVIDKSVVDEDSIDGELVVYGPNVMKGYHNKPAETKDTMTEDGGLRTGDRAYVDEDGFLFITGRIKEQFKLENGKFVYPANIEEEIKLLPYVEHAMIYGLNKPHTVCIIFPDFAVIDKLAKEKGWPLDPAELVRKEEFISLMETEISNSLMNKFGTYEVPKKFLFIHEGFSVENGMLTQTFKLKRRLVLKKYQDAIEELYK
ncbi:MAG: AMP-binding protein [bacterium]|nr:AMP-binding protein [bacterium]